jgi:hypothetical protein
LVANPGPTHPRAGDGDAHDIAAPGSETGILPYARPGSAAHRLMSVLAGLASGEQQIVLPPLAFVVNLVFALAVATVLGQVILGMLAAFFVLVARLRLRSGTPAIFLQAVYDLLLPWLMGMVVLRETTDNGLAPHSSFLLVALYTLVYVACLALSSGARLPALLLLDAVQASVLWMLLARQETVAVWIVGLCLVGQLSAHPGLLAGGDGKDYLRRASVYIVIGMIVAAIAFSPALAGG